MDVGVPAVVDTLASNRDQDLTVISLGGQNQREDVTDDHWLQVGRDLGMTHHLGETSYMGEWSPYFNLNENSSTTYAFIIDRSGLVRWRGDLGSKTEEYYEALRAALEAPSAPPVASGLGEGLAKPLELLVVDERTRAMKELEKLVKRNAKAKKPEQQALATQAGELLASLEAHAAQRLADATAALEAGEAEAFARAARDLSAAYAKSPQHRSLGQLEKAAKERDGFLEAVEAWEEWLDLRAERPATFPARVDKEGAKFARKLKQHLSGSEEVPGRARAEAWLAAWKG